MIPVTLESRWEEILGCQQQPPPTAEWPALRRIRWATWLRLARNAGHKAQASGWARDFEACGECRHRRGGWCTLQELPATVNPITTYRHGMIGMACMGMGHEQRDPVQRSLIR